MPPTVQSGLREALAAVAASFGGGSYVEYSDQAAVQELLRQNPNRFDKLRTVGLSRLGPYAQRIADQVGIDPQRMRVRISSKQQLDVGGLWWGDYDVARVDAWFAAHGGTRSDKDGRTEWRTAEDHRSPQDGPFSEVAPFGSFNVVRTGPGRFAWATAAAAVTDVAEPGADTLDQTPAIGPLADCLGDVSVAVIIGDYPANYAGGVRADHSEVLRALPNKPDRAKTMRDTAERVLAENRSMSGEPYSTALPYAKVTQTGSTVQLTWRPYESTPAGRSLTLFGQSEHIEA